MASRKDEKEARRAERMAAEAAAAAKESRERRLRLVAVMVAVLALVGGGIALALRAGGDGGEVGPEAKLPKTVHTDFDAAVKASGCVYKKHKASGDSVHTDKPVKYDFNPPHSGVHHPEWAEDGEYNPGNTPQIEKWVHTLEHGRILLMYKPETPTTRVNQLRTLFNEDLNGSPGYHKVLMENNTDMDAQVAAVAWGQTLTCDQINDRTFDALRAFSVRFVDKAPEFIP